MSEKLTAALARDLVLGDGYIVRFAAVDPTTGADVSGVTITNVNIDADTLGTSTDTIPAGPYLLVGGPNA